MKPPFRIVPDSIPEDIDGCLSELYRHRKDLIGFAFVAMYKNRRIAVNGRCYKLRQRQTGVAFGAIRPLFRRGSGGRQSDNKTRLPPVALKSLPCEHRRLFKEEISR